MIKAVNLSKRFGETLAVANLNLDIVAGECYGFVGPNGAGKTTTIKLLTGLLKPTTGKIYINGYDIGRDYEEAKKSIGYMPDIPYLYDKLTGTEFIDFIYDIYDIDKKNDTTVADELFYTLELEKYKNRLIEDYSHGMRQKLIFISIFMRKPKVIIIDEPLVGLDPNSSYLIKSLLKQHAQAGNIVFLSTHTLSLVEEICTRVGIIDKGRLIAEDNINNIKKNYAKLEEAFLELTK